MMGTSEGVDDDIVDYLKVKQQMLLSYCIHVTFFLYMKVQGQSVRSHPVMRQLLELRYVMEKMRSLDGKMKHQIDRLMKQNAGMPSSSLRPNPDALVPRDEDDDDDEDDDEDEDEADEGRRKGKSGLYKAPKMAAMPYRENEADSDRREERMRRQRKKLSNSEIMDTLREEFGTAPEAASSSGLSKVNAEQRRLQEEADERRGFEEDRFVRLVSTGRCRWRVSVLVWCGVLSCAVVCCRVLSCAVVCCRVLSCAVVCCRVLWCTVVYCHVLSCAGLSRSLLFERVCRSFLFSPLISLCSFFIIFSPPTLLPPHPPHYHITTPPHHHTTTLPHYHTTTLPHYHITTLPHYHFTLSDHVSQRKTIDQKAIRRGVAVGQFQRHG